MAVLHCGQHFLFPIGNRCSPPQVPGAGHGTAPLLLVVPSHPITLHPITPLPLWTSSYPSLLQTRGSSSCSAEHVPPLQHCWAISFAMWVPRLRASGRRQEQAHRCLHTTIQGSWWVSVVPIPHPQIPPRLHRGCAQCPSLHRGDIHQLDALLLGVLREGDAERDWHTAVRVEGHQQVGAGGGTKAGGGGQPNAARFLCRPYSSLQKCLEDHADLLNYSYPNALAESYIFQSHHHYFQNCSAGSQAYFDPPEDVLLAMIIAPICLIPFLVTLVIWRSKDGKAQP